MCTLSKSFDYSTLDALAGSPTLFYYSIMSLSFSDFSLQILLRGKKKKLTVSLKTVTM